VQALEIGEYFGEMKVGHLTAQDACLAAGENPDLAGAENREVPGNQVGLEKRRGTRKHVEKDHPGSSQLKILVEELFSPSASPAAWV